MAGVDLDFRAGLPREETVWEEGNELTLRQRHETLQLAGRWGMLKSTTPEQPFDRVVVLGGHYDKLKPRMQYALFLRDVFGADPDFVVLCCYRQLHPKEGIDLSHLDTETDLAIELLEASTNESFKLDRLTSWDDSPDDGEKAVGEFAVALTGSVGPIDATFISGSVPGGHARATTTSTLKSLDTYFDGMSGRTLFVTTSLHKPYQTIQIAEVLGEDSEFEVVGINANNQRYPSGYQSDAHFRVILQEIGATIKNGLS